MAKLQKSAVATRSGSSIAVYEGGEGVPVFAIGGMSGTSFADSAAGLILADASSKGVRCVLMDISGFGASKAPAALTMDILLGDVEEVFEARVGEPAAWVAASLGAWLMLLAHRRHPAWFRSLCALAPAIDWDQQCVGPAIREGRWQVRGGTVFNEDSSLAVSTMLLASMAPHHLMRGPVTLAAPMHVIFGGKDELAPPEVTKRFIEHTQGAPCTGEMLPDDGHGVAKLESRLSQVRYSHWLRGQLAVRAS